MALLPGATCIYPLVPWVVFSRPHPAAASPMDLFLLIKLRLLSSEVLDQDVLFPAWRCRCHVRFLCISRDRPAGAAATLSSSLTDSRATKQHVRTVVYLVYRLLRSVYRNHPAAAVEPTLAPTSRCNSHHLGQFPSLRARSTRETSTMLRRQC